MKGSPLTDEITLTVPREKPFHAVAHLVLGGLAVRLNLTLESLEDLQLALAGLLEREEEASAEVTLRVRVLEAGLEAELGPFDRSRLAAELEQAPSEELGLRRILDAVVDDVRMEARDDGAWVVLTKTPATQSAGAR